MTQAQRQVVERWQDAVNAGDAVLAGSLCIPEVEVGGARGSGYGRELVVEWVGHTGIRVTPLRWFCGESGVVVEQDASWAFSCGSRTEPTRITVAFGVREGAIVLVQRYPDLDSGLAAMGLTRADEVVAVH